MFQADIGSQIMARIGKPMGVTTFRLVPEDEPLELDLPAWQRTLPSEMRLEARKGGVYLTVETERPEDPAARTLVERELDRLFFLTHMRMSVSMLRKRVARSLTISYPIYGSLPLDTKPPLWTAQLELQLRLWSISANADEPALRLLLLYQIIELAYPRADQYPTYTDPSAPPDPRTESKLLRHLVAHAGTPTGTQLRNYLQFLGLPLKMANPIDPKYLQVIKSKVPLVESVASSIIRGAL